MENVRLVFVIAKQGGKEPLAISARKQHKGLRKRHWPLLLLLGSPPMLLYKAEEHFDLAKVEFIRTQSLLCCQRTFRERLSHALNVSLPLALQQLRR